MTNVIVKVTHRMCLTRHITYLKGSECRNKYIQDKL